MTKQSLLLTTILTMGFGVTSAVWAQEAPSSAAASNEVTEVIVTGFRSSLQKSLNLKKQAIVTRDSIVAEDIGKFPEANVAEALQRIPGVYLQRDGASNEGQRISIRGLGSEYAVTTINGAPVRTTSSSSAGGSSRSFNYDVFASELFGRVDFYKTPLAELEEGGIGGVVDLQTPRPFDNGGRRNLRYSAIASYNTASQHLDPNVFGLYSQTWGDWGFLLGVAHSNSVNMKSGFEATGGYNSNYRANNPFNYGGTLGSMNGPFTFGLDWDDPRAAAMLPNRTVIDNGYLPRFYRYYGAQNDRSRTGFVSSVQYKRDKLDLSLDFLFSHLTDERDEFTFGLPIRNTRTTNMAARPGTSGHNGLVPINVTLDKGSNLLEGTFGNTSYLGESYFYDSETKFGYVSLNGKYDVSDTLKLTGQIDTSRSGARYDNKRIVSNIYGVTTTITYGGDHVYPGLSAPGTDFTNPANFEDFSTALDWNREVDRELNGRLIADWDYKLPTGWTGHLKGGLVYTRTTKQKTKRNGTALATARLNAVGAAGLRAAMLRSVPLDNLVIGDNYPNAWATFSRGYTVGILNPIGAALDSPIDLSTSFTAEEAITSAFLQSDFEGQVFERTLRVNAGVRYSQTDTTIDNYKKTGANNTYLPNQETSSYDNTTPSVSFAYDLSDKLIWRGSWGKTITRASLSLIAAQTVIPNIYNTYATSGNPGLKPQISTNWDTGLEWYFGRGSLVSAGFFKKKLVDTTVSQTTQVTFGSLGLPDTSLANIYYDANGKVDPNLLITLATYYNAGTIELDGYELAYQQSFNFLPAPWDGLGALASYTHVNSSGYDYRTTDGRTLNVNTIPEYSYSLTGYYEKGPLGIRLTYNYKDRNIIETGPNGSDLQRWHAGAGYLDGNISYKISENLEVRLDVLNLSDTLGYDYFEDVSGRFGDGKDTRLDYAKYDGRTVKLGIRGKF